MYGWCGARGTAVLISGAFFAACLVAGARAHEPATYILDVRQGSHLSDLAEALGHGGYELALGTPISFAPWYHTDWVELHVDMLTTLTDDSGILWGFSTGEHGQKYRIDPSLKLGFITQSHPSEHTILSLSVTTTLWGSLTELPCEADFGELGVHAVNCRLAASELSPEETLQHLVKADPSRLTIVLSYRGSF